MNNVLWSLRHVTLRGRRSPRLADLSLEIRAGVTAVIGFSGAGKTSLLNVLVGFERPDSGDLQSPDLAEDEGDRAAKSRDGDTSTRLPLFWCPQNDGLWPHLSAREHLSAVLPENSQRTAADYLRMFDLEACAEAHPETLSRGERSRLAVARALASEARVLVMDEPLSHVDPARVGDYWRRLRTICQERSTSLVFASHDAETVLREATHVVCLREGRVLWAGAVRELYESPPTRELAGFLGPINWFEEGESVRWLETDAPPIRHLRPEQLRIEPAAESPLIVEEMRFAGLVATAEIRDTKANGASPAERRFWFRPPGEVLQPGMRVRLRAWRPLLLFALLCCLLGFGLSGCAEPGQAQMRVERFRYFPLPPDGSTFPAPRGVHVGPDHELYVLDNAGRVLVFSADGQLVRQWRMPESDIGKPEGICRLKDGRLAVADTHYHRVVFFNPEGEVLEMFGKLGKGPGEFIYPVAIVQDADENLYVCEYGENDRVQKFDSSGRFLLQFGGMGTAEGQFQRPSGIVWREGRLYVVDAFNNRIQMFSEAGEYLGIFDAPEISGGLHYPYDISFDGRGTFVVVEYGAARLSQFDLRGRLIGRYGSAGLGLGEFATPWGVACDGTSRIYVADTGNRRIVELAL